MGLDMVKALMQDYCDLCEKPGSLYGKGRSFDLLSCQQCGLMWTNPLEIGSESETRPDDYWAEDVYLENRETQKKRFRQQLKTFLRQSGIPDLKSIKVLEVGSGLGFFLDVCDELGIEAEGCDVVERAVKYANRERERVRLGTLDSHYADETFDAVFAFNLIEHLAHPKGFLDEAHRVLKTGGHLVLETPIQESLFHRLARLGYALSQGRLNFFGMDPGGHIYKFSKRTFGQTETGFTRVYQRNIDSPFGEIWGKSSISSVDSRSLYRLSLPLAWTAARVTRQENRLFVLLRKPSAPQTA
ncbi:MAG: class I SAM-dependent methyltransferase [Acidobacteria bacterium]|nr:class I SAM-dependent methyltransferase [Acidobacteriota bacterium]